MLSTFIALSAVFGAHVTTIKTAQPWFDTSGNQIDAHGGGFYVEDGNYYWYGSARKNCYDNPGNDTGIHLYSSKDLYNWKFESLVVPRFTLKSGVENGLDIERPKVVQCKPGKYVMWVRGTPIYNGTDLKVGVLTAPAPRGPWKWEFTPKYKNPENAHDPFHLVGPKQYQYGDHTLWKDTRTGNVYLYWRARTPEAGFRGYQLNEDCTDVVEATDTHIFNSPNREAPAFFSHEGSFYLWASGTMGWAPQQAYAYKGPTPLGPFNSSMGHGWHAYLKIQPSFNTTKKYTVRDGYMPMGNDWVPPKNATLSACSALCTSSESCKGFTFKSHDRVPNATTTIKCLFKTVPNFVPEGDPEGLQPPPIPEPGSEGNKPEDGQPGILAYGSQSTFVLPNPAYAGPGSKLPQFIYMADRWQPDTANFGLYVWLPLFIDPKNPARISVPWQPYWRLDNVTSPFM